MKLYYSPGACSLSPHIVLKELGLPFTIVKTNLREKTLEDGSSPLAINSKGQVPVLMLDNGEFLTEGVAIVSYLADLVPEKGLMPKEGLGRYRVLEWLNYIATELHKGYSPLFSPVVSDDAKQQFREILQQKLKYVEQILGAAQYIVGNQFTPADAYLFTVLSWSKWVKVEVPVGLEAYVGRIAQRPAVQAALQAEGLLK